MIVVLLCNFPQHILFIIVFMFVTCTPVRGFGQNEKLSKLLNSHTSVINGWMTRDFTSCSTVFKLCQDDEQKITKRCKGTPLRLKRSHQAGLEPGTTRSAARCQ